MKTLVLDASVAAAAFFDEEHADRADALLASGDDLLAPEFICVEFANVIWKRFGRKEIDDAQATGMLATFRDLPLQLVPCDQIITSALTFALSTRRTVYDCLYLALAVQTRGRLITGDRRFYNALSGSSLARHILWIGDVS